MDIDNKSTKNKAHLQPPKQLSLFARTKHIKTNKKPHVLMLSCLNKKTSCSHMLMSKE